MSYDGEHCNIRMLHAQCTLYIDDSVPVILSAFPPSDVLIGGIYCLLCCCWWFFSFEASEALLMNVCRTIEVVRMKKRSSLSPARHHQGSNNWFNYVALTV